MKVVEDKVSEMLFGCNGDSDGTKMLVMTHKSVAMTVAVADDWVSIYSIESENEGKGEAQEAILELRKMYPEKTLWGSAPMNSTIQHIFDKLNVKYGEEEL